MEEGKGAVGYVGCEWYERGVAYYAVNTVHIGVRAAGEEITSATLHPPPTPSTSQPFSPRTNLYTYLRPY